MSGPLTMSRVLTAAAIAGALGAAAMATTPRPGSPPRIAPPCSPDGVCLPRTETWGWYPTRWRPFPGDAMSGTPTKAGGGEGGEGPAEDELRGPVLPESTKEGEVGPQKKRGAAGGAAPAPTLPEGAAPEGAAPGPVAPGAEPATPPGLPPIEGVPAEGAPQPRGPAAPGTIPDPTTDPFGAAPPAPPAWMSESASLAPRPAARAVAPRTSAAPSVNNAPNLQGDDAPPALPSQLQGMLGASAARPKWSQASAASTALVQPPSIRTAAQPTNHGGVMQASAEIPLGIQLINPASALSVDPGAAGLQQAIYFEASDQPTASAVQLPPVLPVK